MVIKEQKTEDTYAYTYETPAEWTPYNSNLQMHGIKVLVSVYLMLLFSPHEVHSSFLIRY